MSNGKVHRSSGGQKVEPRPHGVNPGAVSYLGNKLGNHSMEEGTFTLRTTPWATEGFKAPPVKGVKRNPNGSQGRY